MKKTKQWSKNCENHQRKGKSSDFLPVVLNNCLNSCMDYSRMTATIVIHMRSSDCHSTSHFLVLLKNGKS